MINPDIFTTKITKDLSNQKKSNSFILKSETVIHRDNERQFYINYKNLFKSFIIFVELYNSLMW
ncbi:hypothetical protein C8P67_111145 [Flavobacterium aquicola]|uniref:Uncharacterized protein n=1 Tax=Flavobacterium aquicola TaxID=1682742 RepID=A0A3E0ED49_9FLAO|nr:hypothetical protein C8P67_111145 [Flavobacterium aquicola]